MNRNSRIFIVGHNDSIDNSLYGYFTSKGFKHTYSNVRHRIDVLHQSRVQKFFKDIRPEYVFLGSIRSGSIGANQKFPAEFIYANCQAQNHVIHEAYAHHVRKLLYFSGSCAYPKEAKQPISEDALLTGSLESTSEAYSVAKIAGVKMCQAYRAQYHMNAIAAVPATLYGPGSDTDLENAHVMGALIAKFVKAVQAGDAQVSVWGSGKPSREFLYVDDFTAACDLLMRKYDESGLINLGCGEDVSIKDLAKMISGIAGFKGKIVFDASKPDGTMRKLMDNRRITKLGFKPKVSLEKGITKTIQWYKSINNGKGSP